MLSWFKRDREDAAPHEGVESRGDSLLALCELENAVCDALSVVSTNDSYGDPGLPFSEVPFSGAGGPVRLHRPGDVAGTLAGWSVMGMRGAAFLTASDLQTAWTELSHAALARLPFLVHSVEGTTGVEAGDSGLSPNPLLMPGNRGGISVVASDPQEALDLALIAHRAAEQSMSPAVCHHLGSIAPFSSERLRVPDQKLVERYLGSSDDEVETPTPSQVQLFGPRRQRIPRLVDLGRPLGIGAPMYGLDAAKAALATNAFFAEHVPQLLSQAARTYADLTGRQYDWVSGYHTQGADVLVVCYGSVTRDFVLAAEILRRERKLKAGVVQIRLASPFPVEQLVETVGSAPHVTVLARSMESPDLLLHAVQSAFSSSEESKHSPEILSCRLPSLRNRVSLSEAMAVFENMAGDRRQTISISGTGKTTSLRLPRLERQNQLVRRDYPDLERTLVRSGSVGTASESGQIAHIALGPSQHVFRTGRAIARLVEENTGNVTTARPGDDRHAPLSGGYSIVSGESSAPGDGIDVLATDEHWLSKNASIVSTVRVGGKLVVQVGDDDPAFPERADRWVREQILSRSLQVFLIRSAPGKSVPGTDLPPGPHVALARLAGSWLKVAFGIDASADSSVGPRYTEALGIPGDDDLNRALARGAEGATRVQVEPGGISGARETAVPEAFRNERYADETIFDSARFWDDVGYLNETGRGEATLVDPYIATATMPGRTGLFVDHESSRTRTPVLSPDLCTGCGLCYAWCPEGALPPSVHSLETLVAQAISLAESEHGKLPELGRQGQNMSKIAQRLVRRDTSNHYKWLGEVITDAGNNLIERLNPQEEQAETMRIEVASIAAVVGGYPIVKTERFFSAPESKKKGTGLIFSMTLDSRACTGCAVCQTVCPEEAFKLVQTAPEAKEETLFASQYARALPAVPAVIVKPFTDESSAETEVFRLLSGKTYQSVSVGWNSPAGGGIQTTIRLIASVVQSMAEEPLSKHVARIDNLIERTRKEIHGILYGSEEADDEKAFAGRLDSVLQGRLGVEEFIKQSGPSKPAAAEVDDVRRLTDLLRGLDEIRQEYPDRGLGRASIVAALSTRMASRLATYPYNPLGFPWMAVGGGSIAAATRGLFDGVARRTARELATLRRAELSLDRVYDRSKHDDFLSRFGWEDFDDDEWAVCPSVVVFMDNELDQIADLVKSGLPIKVFRFTDLSSAESTAAGLEASLDRNVYVLQSTAGKMEHLLAGIREGLAYRGPAFSNLYCADPTAQGFDPGQTPEIMRLGVDSRAFPVFTFDPTREGDWARNINISGNPEPDRDWVTSETNELGVVTLASWGKGQAVFRKHFEVVPLWDWQDEMVPFEAFLALPESERATAIPYVAEVDDKGKERRYRVSEDFQRMATGCLAQWRLLQEVSGVRSSVADRIRNEFEKDTVARLDATREEVTAALQSQMEREMLDHGGVMHARLTERLLQLSGFGAGLQSGETTLRDFSSERLDPSEGTGTAENSNAKTNGHE